MRGNNSVPSQFHNQLLGSKPLVKLSLLLGNDILNASITESLLENRKSLIDVHNSVNEWDIILCDHVCTSRILI